MMEGRGVSNVLAAGEGRLVYHARDLPVVKSTYKMYNRGVQAHPSRGHKECGFPPSNTIFASERNEQYQGGKPHELVQSAATFISRSCTAGFTLFSAP